MSKPTVKKAAENPSQHEYDSSDRFIRWGFLGIGLLMLASMLVLKLKSDLLGDGTLAVSELSGRVGLVLLSASFAWPAILTIRKSPGGMIVLILGMAAIILFVARPRTLYLMGPIVVIVSVLAWIAGWIRRLRG